MLLFSVLFMVIIIMGILCLAVNYRDISIKKVYCITISLLLFLISGLRSNLVGTDSYSYAMDVFVNIFQFNFESLYELMLNEPAFKVLNSLANQNYTVLFCIVAGISCSIIGFMIYRYSLNPMISFCMYISMGYFYFTMAGLRQTVGMSICFYAVYLLISRNKPISFFVLILFASLFQHVSLIALLYYPISKIKLNKTYILGISIISIITFIYGNTIIESLVGIFWPNRIFTEEYGGISTIILLIIIGLSALFIKYKLPGNSEEYEIDDFFLKNFLVSIPIQILAIYQANAFRAAMYFALFSIFIVPNMTMRTKKYGLFYGIVAFEILLLLLQYYFFTAGIADILPYTFFWEV